MAYNKETGMYEGFIYKITNKINGHFYIGQTRTTIKECFYCHTKDCTIEKNQKYGLYRAFKKYGVTNFNIEELDSFNCKTEDELKRVLNEKEYEYITSMKEIFKKEYIYNQSDGGDFDGCAIEKVPVIQYDLSCHELNRFDSIIEATINTDCYSISKVINKCDGFFSSGGYIWRKQNEPLTEKEINDLRIRFDKISINQYCIGTNILNTFSDTEDAATYVCKLLRKNNDLETISKIKMSIRYCCNGNYNTAYGFIWKYTCEPLSDDKVIMRNHYSTLAVEQRENGTGKLLNIFVSSSDAEHFTGVDGACISQCCNHNSDLAGGYLWNYCGDYNPIILEKVKTKPVVQLSMDGTFISTYNSPKEAAIKTNSNYTAIIGVCKGRTKSSNGYKWMYQYQYLNILNNEGGEDVA